MKGIEKLEGFLELGGTKKDITLLVLSGIALGGVGSDIAVDAADIALVDDEVKELPHLVALAKRMMVTIKRNMTFSMTLNFVAIVLAMTGILNPAVGALVHNAGSVLVITNSALLLKGRKQKNGSYSHRAKSTLTSPFVCMDGRFLVQ